MGNFSNAYFSSFTQNLMAMVCSNERYIVAWMGNENEFYRKQLTLLSRW